MRGGKREVLRLREAVIENERLFHTGRMCHSVRDFTFFLSRLFFLFVRFFFFSALVLVCVGNALVCLFLGVLSSFAVAMLHRELLYTKMKTK